ncbi:MAG: serine/threonine protein kinase, partial [Actinobacteria bacterium]|nr:serine/threonine protein kinase [Actinomycetota bacterium]
MPRHREYEHPATRSPRRAGVATRATKREASMVGELILGRFRVERRIGSGGFGTVYRAWDERLERPVAVKAIESDAAAPRVVREAQAVARLEHRNLATLYELASENGHAYLVSELIDGPTLRAAGRRGELSDRLVASIGADCAAALSHAHRNGVVHRDVKPENVLIAPGGEAKLVDFGIARITGQHTLTNTGDVLGTLGYMAPEQAEGQRPGPAADVYSLGLTLYECFSGEHPRVGEGPAATARAISEPVLPLAGIRPDLPEPVTDAIDSALDTDPELRPLASELEGALAATEGEMEGTALPPVLRPSDPEIGPGRPRDAVEALARFAPAASILVLTMVALLVAGAPGPVLLAAPLAGLIAVARPRPGLATGAAATVGWTALGAGEPGAALVAALLVAPLFLVPAESRSLLALPGLAPVLGVSGLGAAYPALAGLSGGFAARALLGACGYLWLAAWELASGRTLLIGPDEAAAPGWEGSASAAASEVVAPLLAPGVVAVAALWAAAAAALPLLVRGRVPVLDVVGALLWAAGLISLTRLLAGSGGEPAGLLFASALA